MVKKISSSHNIIMAIYAIVLCFFELSKLGASHYSFGAMQNHDEPWALGFASLLIASVLLVNGAGKANRSCKTESIGFESQVLVMLKFKHSQIKENYLCSPFLNNTLFTGHFCLGSMWSYRVSHQEEHIGHIGGSDISHLPSWAQTFMLK